ncbi:MAG: hypothetical protein V3V14_10070, partial [Saprospiraceae bacterium]
MKFLSFVILLILLQSCNNEPNQTDKNTITIDGEYNVTDTLIIQEGKRMVINPGADVLFSPGAIIIAFG